MQRSRPPAQSRRRSRKAPPQNSATSAAEARLNKKQFRDVKVAVDNGIATPLGTVALYEYKADAEKERPPCQRRNRGAQPH